MTSDSKTFYDVLGVSADASLDDIKKAYRRLSFIHHPDKNSSPDSTQMFQKIAEAFSVLSDPSKRESYNHELKYGGMGSGSRMFTAEINPHEIFNMLFGGGGGLGGAGLGGLFHGLGGGLGGEIHIIQGNLGMGGGIQGMFHPMMMHMQHQHHHHQANQAINIMNQHRQQQQQQYQQQQEQQQQQQQQQSRNHSVYEPEIVLKMDSESESGESETELIFEEPLPPSKRHTNKTSAPPPLIEKTVHITMEQAYSGTTVHVEYEQLVQESDLVSSVKQITVAVTIPRGTHNNESITLSRIGNIGANGACGDVRLTVAFIPHATFSTADGAGNNTMDIVMHKKITLKESLCGVQFEFTHLNGKSYQIINKQIGSVIQPESIKTINGLGFVRDSPQQQHGSLHIVFHVMYPESISVDLYNVMSTLL
jgi:DnaJ-class molecular chaperone